MKKRILAVLIGSVTMTSLAQAEVTLFDYQEANSSYEEAYLNGSFFIGKGRGDDQSAYNFNVNANYDKTQSTADRDLNLKADVDASISRDGSAGADSSDSYTAGASITTDNYLQPGSNGTFWYGSASIRGNDAFDDLETTAGIGLGYGRVTNVTPMAKAIRIIDELTKRGALSAKPGKATYQEIAKVVSRESEYASRYGNKDYELHWIADIEKALQQSGTVNGNLNTAGILKSRDILVDEKISLRRYGWKTRVGLGYVGTNFDGLTNKPSLEAAAEYHMPLNNQSQFSDEASVRAILNDGDDAYNFSNTMSLTHEVDDRIDWENVWSLDYSKNSSNGDDVTTNTLSSTFIYELNNQLDFTTTARLANVNGSTDANNPDGTDRSVLMGVRYRLR